MHGVLPRGDRKEGNHMPLTSQLRTFLLLHHYLSKKRIGADRGKEGWLKTGKNMQTSFIDDPFTVLNLKTPVAWEVRTVTPYPHQGGQKESRPALLISKPLSH